MWPSADGEAVGDAVTATCGPVSPTNDTVAITILGTGGDGLAMLLPLSGGPGRRVLEPNQVPRAWSPDGRQLLFTHTAGSPFDLGILNLADGSTRRITNTPANETGTEWSADGSTLVFTRHVPDVRITTADLTRLLARRE